MNEIIKLVTDKAGISPEQAQKAVETVMHFMKDKLPAGLSSQIEGLLSGNAPAGGGLGGMLGGLLGGGEKK